MCRGGGRVALESFLGDFFFRDLSRCSGRGRDDLLFCMLQWVMVQYVQVAKWGCSCTAPAIELSTRNFDNHKRTFLSFFLVLS